MQDKIDIDVQNEFDNQDRINSTKELVDKAFATDVNTNE